MCIKSVPTVNIPVLVHLQNILSGLVVYVNLSIVLSEDLRLCHLDNITPISCLLNCNDKVGVIAWATDIRGSEVIRNRLGYVQYKAHSPSHLSSKKNVSLPLPTVLFMPNSTMCLMEIMLD